MAQYPNGFGNGISYAAGNDFNGDGVYVRITETQSVPTKPTTWGRIKGLYQ